MNTIIGLVAVIGLAVVFWKVRIVGVSKKKAEGYVALLLLAIIALALALDPILG